MTAQPTPPNTAPESGRRSVLNWLLGTWSAGVLGAIAFPVLRYLVPPEIPEAPTLSVKAGAASTLTPNTARIVPFGSTPAIVVRTAAGELKAFEGDLHAPRVHGAVPHRPRAHLVRLPQRPLRPERQEHRRPAAAPAHDVRRERAGR